MTALLEKISDARHTRSEAAANGPAENLGSN